MGAGVARQCSRNRCLARWTVRIPHRGRGGAAGRATRRRPGHGPRSEVFVPFRRRRGDREARRPVFADGPQTARHPAAIPVAVGLAPEPLPLLNRQRPQQTFFASVPWWDSRGGQIEAGLGPRGKDQDRGRPLGRTQPPVSAVGLGSVEVLDEQQIDHPGTDQPERPPGGREHSAFNSLTRQVPPALGDPRLVGHHAQARATSLHPSVGGPLRQAEIRSAKTSAARSTETFLDGRGPDSAPFHKTVARKSLDSPTRGDWWRP